MRKRFLFSLLADVIFVLGLVAIVVGIALAGYGPLAFSVAGIELVILAVLLSPGLIGADGGDDG